MDTLGRLSESKSGKKNRINKNFQSFSRSSSRCTSCPNPSTKFSRPCTALIGQSFMVKGRRVRPKTVAEIDCKLKYNHIVPAESRIKTPFGKVVCSHPITNAAVMEGVSRLTRISLMSSAGIIESDTVEELVHHIQQEYNFHFPAVEAEVESLCLSEKVCSTGKLPIYHSLRVDCIFKTPIVFN